MTGLKWKRKTNKDGDLINNCWLTECGYTVAKCFIGDESVYQVTAPKERAPLAHPRTKADVVKVINLDKELRSDRD